MRDRPEKAELLRAVARFLDSEVRPALSGDPAAAPRDPQALAFRVLIASHLATLVAAESEAECELDRAELQRLALLLPIGHGAASPRRAERRAAVLDANRELASRIRARSLSEGERQRVVEHVKATLREELAVTNPKFDTSADID